MRPMKRRLITVVATLIALLLIPATAWAGDCVNKSRPAPSNSDQIQVVGNWAWFPGFGWTFLAPGTDLSEFAGAPGSSGNFQNGDGHALLDGAAACDNPNRQTDHGIQRTELFVSC